VGPPSGEAAQAQPVEVAAVEPSGSAAGGRRLYSEGEVDGIAAPTQRVRPHYPEKARMLGRESDVRVAVTVEADGAVSDVTVVKSGGVDFDEQAVTAIRRERWRPARRAGEAVAAVVSFTVRFRLD
jgi:TonB family protein